MAFRNRNILEFILVAFIILDIQGCVSFTRDVSHHKEWWGGYVYEQEYVLLKDVFLLTDNTEKYFLVPDKSVFRYAGIKSAPESVEDYRNSPKKIEQAFEDEWKDTIGNKILGIVDAGTRIKCVRLEKLNGFSIWWGFENGIEIYGKIIDGPFTNFEVNMQDVSTFNCCGRDCDNDPILFKPDSRLLK